MPKMFAQKGCRDPKKRLRNTDIDAPGWEGSSIRDRLNKPTYLTMQKEKKDLNRDKIGPTKDENRLF